MNGRALVRSLDSLPELSRKPNWTLKGVYGSVFESTVMCNIYMFARQRGYAIYFYRKNNDAEVDIVLENEYGEMQRDFILLEVKSTSDMDTAIVKSKWLNIVSKRIPFFVNLVGAYIVYQGKTGIFNEFESQDMFGTKAESVKEIAGRNKGTLCINVDELLTNFDKYIKFNEEG